MDANRASNERSEVMGVLVAANGRSGSDPNRHEVARHGLKDDGLTSRWQRPSFDANVLHHTRRRLTSAPM